MSLPSQTQVLVVGAGPCGLARAVTLARLGLQATVVESLPAGKEGTRASVIHPHTLEVLDTIELAKPLIESGIQAKGMAFHGTTGKILEVNVAQLRNETAFPAMLLIPQDEVETILQARLKSLDIRVFRNQTALGVNDGRLGGGLDVKFEGGVLIRAQYVVGADGSRSTIRRLAGIDFKNPSSGVDYDSHVADSRTFRVVLADVTFQEPIPTSMVSDQVIWHLDKALLLIPLRRGGVSGAAINSTRYWRMGIVIPAGASNPPRIPSLDYLQRELDERNPWTSKLIIASVFTTPTNYRVRSSVASTFFKTIGSGKILLVGDAAHVHSPAGGQGMNLGLCDAVTLAHFIHAHVDASATSQEADCILPNYSISRRRRAIRVINMTRRLTAVVNATGWWGFLRSAGLRVVGCSSFLTRAIARRLSGLGNRDD